MKIYHLLFFCSAHLEKPTLTRHPKFEVMYRGESVTFTCTVDLSYQWNFQWFHNGIEIPGSNSTYTIAVLDHPSSGEYHCRANRSVEPFSTEQSDPLTLKVSGKPNIRYIWWCCQHIWNFQALVISWTDMYSRSTQSCPEAGVPVGQCLRRWERGVSLRRWHWHWDLRHDLHLVQEQRAAAGRLSCGPWSVGCISEHHNHQTSLSGRLYLSNTSRVQELKIWAQ